MDVEEQLNLPSWLDSQFLCSTLGGDVTVRHVRVKRAVAKGENYLSVLYRVQVECEDDQSYSLIIKTFPEGDAMRKFLAEMKGFEKELHMYHVTLPAIHKVFGEAHHRDITARALCTSRKDVIVLEDLQTLGYRMAERSAGLDLDHAVQTVRALAYLHAGSVRLLRDDPASLDKYEETFFREGEWREAHKGYFNMHIDTLTSQIDKWPGYQHFAPRVRNLKDIAIDYMMEVVQPKEGSFSVLNHGDCWVNNMLYLYDEDTGKVRDVRFVDFQITRYASPALDLQYVLNTSLNDEIRFKEQDRLLEEYHQELTLRFTQLGISEDTYTLQQLRQDYKDTALFGFFTTCTLLCIVLADRSAAPDFSDLPEGKVPDKNPLEKAYEGDRFRQVFQTFLDHYQDSGIF